MKLLINSEKSEISWNKRDYLLAAAKRLGLDWVVEYVPYDGKTEFEAPEYVLNIEPYQKFVKGEKWTGIWEIDVMFDRPEMSISDWTHSDVVFLANTNVPSRMMACETEKIFLFQAADPVLHRRIASVPQDKDFVLSCSMGLDIYRDREKAVESLKKAGFTYEDYGKGMPPHKYVECLNHAKVQFIRSASKLPVGSSQVEQRFFECLAIGPVLKDYHPALETLGLVEREDFFWYKDEEEMLSKMRYLLEHPEFAQEMAEKGRRKVLMYHTYEHRLMTILNYINEHISKSAQ